MPTSPCYRNIVCAVDFSPPSRAALQAAIDLTRRFDATLTLVHVYQIPKLGAPEPYPGSPLRTSMAQLAEQALAEWKREAEVGAGRSVTTAVLEGNPWDRIVKYAHEHRVELVVVGTHGRSWIKRALIGSVAENVVRHASCPVLVARPQA